VALEGFLKREVSEEQAVTQAPSLHEIGGDLPVLSIPRPPACNDCDDIDHGLSRIAAP
jgi:hypothetical protein